MSAFLTTVMMFVALFVIGFIIIVIEVRRKQPEIKPMATMEAAWAKHDHLWAEGGHLWTEGLRMVDGGGHPLWAAEASRLWAQGDRLRTEGDLVVILTAQALYGIHAQIDWQARTVKTWEETK